MWSAVRPSLLKEWRGRICLEAVSIGLRLREVDTFNWGTWYLQARSKVVIQVFVWCHSFVLHSRTIPWFCSTAMHPSGHSMPPTKRIRRITATGIPYCCKVTPSCTPWCHSADRTSESTVWLTASFVETSLLAVWIGQSSALWWSSTTGLSLSAW